jgi:hypothetical protein
MYKGSSTINNRRCIAEIKKYHSGVTVIFNEKAYANTLNLTWWVKSMYSSATAYPLSDREPQLLTLDAFAPHKNKGKKIPENETAEAMEKRVAEEKANQQLRNEFTKLNTTLSIIPSGCTSYVQVLDVLVNKIIKNYIEELEQEHYDNNIEDYESGRVSVEARRVLLTHWVAKA